MQVTLQISAETPQLQKLQRLLSRPRGVTAAAANGVARLWKAHFATRNREGNRMGWPSSNFFAKQGVKATAVDTASMTETTATVLVASPQMAFRQRGGLIRPRAGKRYLALPATAEAYKLGSPMARDGARQELAFAFAKHPHGGWRPALVRRQSEAEALDLAAIDTQAKGAARKLRGLRARQDKRGREHEVQYWLVRRATIPADPRILPPPMITEMEALEAARDYVNRRLAPQPPPETTTTS